MKRDKSKPLILTVDDVPKNLQVLGAILYQEGYEIAMADNGPSAIEMLRDIKPDLILLDIMMPEMDGYEVCEKLKSDTNTKDIPIIFLTAKHEAENIIQGFKLGAVDYITKPFNSEELIARVKTHIDLRASKRRVVEYSRELEYLLKKKSEFLGMAVHDMKNPLNSIIGFANIALAASDAAIKTNCPDSEKLTSYLNKIRDSAEFMFRTINEMLNTETLETGKIKLKPVECDISKIALSVLAANKPIASAKNISIYVSKLPVCKTLADEDRIREVIENLVSNAIKYSYPGSRIWLSVKTFAENGKKFFRLSIKDEGPGLNEDDKQRVFGRFEKLSAQPTAGEESSGLGLSIVKKLVDLHGGKVWVESQYGEGATFIVEAPASADADLSSSGDEADFKLFEIIDDTESENNLDFDISDAGAPENLDEDGKDRLRDLVKLLEEDYMSYWNKVNQTNVINDIRAFGVDAREIGKSFGVALLEKYGEELKTQCANFDIERLPRTLSLYPEIVKKIKAALI